MTEPAPSRRGLLPRPLAGGALAGFVVLFLQKKLEPRDRAMLDALAGLVSGALLAATLRS